MNKQLEFKLTEEQRKLLTDNIDFLYWVAGQFLKKTKYSNKYTLEEVASMGAKGFCRAAVKWIPAKGKFTTYAYNWINHFISIEIVNDRTIHVPYYVKRTDYAGKRIDRFQEKLDAMHKTETVTTLNENITGNLIWEDNVEFEYEDDRKSQLLKCLEHLPEPDQTIIRERYALNAERKKYTLEEIGQHIGYTKERVRQMQNRALCSLRRAMGV